MIDIKKQNGSNWLDETGAAIPANRVTKAEKFKESAASRLAKKAIALSDKLAEYKTEISNTCAEVIEIVRKENEIKSNSKGNFTWYNFDQSIKVEVNINEAIRFDEVLIDGAKQKLLHIIENNVQAEDFIKSIIVDAFQTTNGRLDTKRVLGLKRHTTRISNKVVRAEWDEAMSLIDKSITRPESKSYYRISIKNSEGKFENVDLNFSSVEPKIEEQ